MATDKKTPIEKLAQKTLWLEKAALLIIIVAVASQLAELSVPYLLETGLTALAIAFFLSAFRHIDIKPDGEEKGDFNELMGLMIVPKLIWISCSISTMGILFYLMDLDNEGYMQMLLIGATTIFIVLILLAYLILANTKHISAVNPILGRALPILAIDLYILFF